MVMNDVGTIGPPNVEFTYVPALTSIKLLDRSDKLRFVVVYDNPNELDGETNIEPN